MFHCAQLLRQVVRCGADATLDPAFAIMRENGSVDYASAGTGGTHLCRDYDKLRVWAEEHRVHNPAGEDPAYID